MLNVFSFQGHKLPRTGHKPLHIQHDRFDGPSETPGGTKQICLLLQYRHSEIPGRLLTF